MSSLTTPESPAENTRPAQDPGVQSGPDFSASPRPIAEFASQPDFPRCALGAYVDIGGYAGVVADIVNNSIKVRAPDGISQSFNFHRLRTIYGPPAPRPEPLPADPTPEPPRERRPAEGAPPPAARSAPKREIITDPDFCQPVKPIRELAGRPDFPKCAYGLHVEIAGYTGVVVELVNQSLKVLSPDGVTRSFNGPALRKLHGGG